jgi:predicted nucleic acid-binding protein
LSKSAAIRFLALLNDLPINVIQEAPTRMTKKILELARECQISTYDASYLDLAMRKGLPISTLDSGLKKAALAWGVPIFKPT